MTAPVIDEVPDRTLTAPDGTEVTLSTMTRWHFGMCREAKLLTLLERLVIARRLEGLDGQYPPLGEVQLVSMARVGILAGIP